MQETAGKFLEKRGYASMAVIGDYVGKHENTLYTMYKRYPDYFEALAIGVSVKVGLIKLRSSELENTKEAIERRLMAEQIISLASKLANQGE